MKLLHIIPTYKPAYGYGGPIISIGLLCENLVSEGGCDVTVAATNANIKKDLPVHSKTPVLVEGVKVYYFRRITPDHSQLSPSLLWWLWRNAKQFDAVHIHSWWNLTVLFSTTVCILRGVKPVLSPRGMLSTFTIKGKWKPLFQRFLGKKLLERTFLHATARQERDECLELIPHWESHVLPNILDIPIIPISQNSHQPNKTFHLLFLSRIHEKKGIDILLKALPNLPFDWTLTIAGDGEASYIEELKLEAKRLGIVSSNGIESQKIKWLGWVKPEDRFDIFEQADLFVLPSHNENFANVVIESLAVGTPVLVSRYVGLSDYILGKKLGWVCETTVENLQNKLTEAFFQKSERQRMHKNAPEQIRADFAPVVLVAKYMELYRHVSPKKKIEKAKSYFQQQPD